MRYRTLKIAVIGTGRVARDNYVPFLARQEDVTLAYYNRTPQTAREVAERFGGEVLSDLSAVGEWNPTAALVLTSETARYDIATALIDQGVPRLFFEKPLVAARGQAHVTEEDFQNGKTLLERAKARGIETAMVFNYRFFAQTETARSIAAERAFGPVISVVGLVHYACWSHCIDLLHGFAGEVTEITALSGTVERQAGGMTAADVAAALRTAGGATATLIGTAGMQWQHPLYEMVFTFEKGRLHMRDLDGTLEVLDGARQTHEVISLVRQTSRWEQYADSFRKALHAYLESLRKGEPPPVPGIAGLRELQTEAALKRSIAQRRPVLVQEEFPLGVS